METPTEPNIADILGHCELFAALSAADCARIAARCQVRSLKPGTVIFSEGETGTHMFVLIDGVLEAFKTTGDDEVVLQRIDHRGNHFGSNSLRPGTGGVRRASVRSVGEARVIVVPREVFREAMDLNPGMVEHLETIHHRQTRQLSLVEQSVMYRALVLFDQEHGWSREEHFEPGEVIFREGDPGTSVYVIRSGTVKISRIEDGDEVTLSMLHDGQAFGELAVLEGRDRGATATAQGAVELVTFDREQFLHATAKVPELHQYLGTLKRVYAMGEAVATMFDGEFRGEPAVVTVVRLDDGREAIVNHVIERDIYSASLELPAELEVQEYTFRDDHREILRTLALHDGGLVRVHAEGPWTELGQIHALLLEQSPLDPTALERFVETGHLIETGAILPPTHPQAVLCQCLGLTRVAIESTLAHGAVTLDEVSRETGATTVCGGCTATIAAMLGSTGQAVRLTEQIEITPAVRSFRFVPCGRELQENQQPEPLRTALPGQHVMVSAEIGGAWVHRPYTITSAAGSTEFREITVRREDHGFLSNWLFKHPGETNLKLSHPKGEFWIDPEVPETVVCLVAGIGMTPALAMARSIDASASEVRLHIDYSARTERDFAYRQELDEIAFRNEGITINYRATGGRQHLDRDGVAAICRRFRAARFMICGPPAYQTDVCRHLRAAGVKPSRTKVEVFTPVGHAPTELAPGSGGAERWHRIATIALSLAYLLQALLGWTVPPLEALQQIDAYRIATGSALLGLIGYQWYLPSLRWRGRAMETAGHARIHRSLGVAAPPLLYLHSAALGYAYTYLLPLLFIANALVGAADRTLIADPEARRRYFDLWLLVHVPLSFVVTALALIHLVYALAYK